MSEYLEAKESKRIIKIAIVDSGINEYPGIKGKVIEHFNAINTNTSYVDDQYNHGTSVASIIADKNLGLNPNTELYSVKFLDSEGIGEIEALYEGLKWAISNDVDIINLSIGFNINNTKIENVIKKAISKKIIVVASSGNTYGFGTDFPARMPEVLSIGSISSTHQKSIFSGDGKIDYVTIGENIAAIDNSGIKVNVTGTSYSAAYFTGVISLIASKFEDKELAYDFITNDLEKFAFDLGEKNLDNKFGFGLIELKTTK